MSKHVVARRGRCYGRCLCGAALLVWALAPADASAGERRGVMTVTVEVIVACTVRTDAAGGAAVGCGDAGAEPSGGSRYAAPFRPDGPGVPATSVAGGGPVAVESGRDGPGLVTVIY